MPALRNPRHERFARYVMKYGVALHAFVKAGYRSNKPASLRSAASRLLASVNVQARIQELQAMALKRHEITVDTLLGDLEADRGLAHREGQGSAAVQATMAKARLLGLIVDRKETGKPGEFENMQTTADVLQAVRVEFGDAVADALAREFEQAAPSAEQVGQRVRTKSPPKRATNSGSGSVN